jgi:hypothetical protein
MYQGFVDEENQITCSRTRFFERYHKFSIKIAIRKAKHYSKELTTLAVGDCNAYRSRNRALWRTAENTGRE